MTLPELTPMRHRITIHEDGITCACGMSFMFTEDANAHMITIARAQEPARANVIDPTTIHATIKRAIARVIDNELATPPLAGAHPAVVQAILQLIDAGAKEAARDVVTLLHTTTDLPQGPATS